MGVFIKKRKYYRTKQFENPFFQCRRRGPRLHLPGNWRLKLIVAGVLAIILLIGWFFLYSNIFLVNKVTINGLTRVSNDEIEEEVLRQTRKGGLLIGSQRNIFLFNEDELKATLVAEYAFNNLTVKKKLFHEVILDIQEKPYALIWNESDKYYYTDADGFIIKEVNPLDITTGQYPLVANQSASSKIADNRVNLGSEYSAYISALFNEFKNQPDYPVEKFIIDDEQKTVKVKLLNGPQIYFNIETPAPDQIAKMITLKQEKLKDDFFNKVYIDVRFGDRIYYR